MLENGCEHADVCRMGHDTGGHNRPGRFTSSMMSYSLPARLALTALTCLVGLFLLLNLISNARADDPRPAALVFFFFGIWAFVAWRFLRHLWRPGIDWVEERRKGDLRSEHIAENVEHKPQTHLSFVTFDEHPGPSGLPWGPPD
jgi:hypothetical protein